MTSRLLSVSRESWSAGGGVAEELVVDDIGQASLGAAERLFIGVALGAFAEVVGAPGGMLTGLGDGHDVQGEVELAVAGAREPMTDDVAAGGFDPGDPALGGEAGSRREGPHSTDPPEDLGRQDGTAAEAVFPTAHRRCGHRADQRRSWR